jgi:hypothetical protein
MIRALLFILAAASALGLAPPRQALAMEIVDVEEQLRIIASGENPTPRIAGAEFRIGSFSYEDPDATGLGDALAALVGHEMLLNTDVRSLGVLVFAGSLAPAPGERLGYYDKVERVTAAQAVSIATWGMVRRVGDELVIDTYLQIPDASLVNHFSWQHALPSAMGGGLLRARLGPARFRVQSLRVPAAAAAEFADAAAMLGELRESPQRASRVTGRVPRGEVYYVRERAGDWVRLQTRRGNGWVPLRGHCIDSCAALPEAARFAGALVRFMSRPQDPPVPDATPGLSVEALAVTEQLQALVGLRGFGEDSLRRSLALASRWTGAARRTGVDEVSGIDRGEGMPPGGAAFANLRVIAMFGAALAQAGSSGTTLFDDIQVPGGTVRGLADELARASLDDPRNIEVLENLAVLFAAAGDGRRASLAHDIALKAQNGPRPD